MGVGFLLREGLRYSPNGSPLPKLVLIRKHGKDPECITSGYIQKKCVKKVEDCKTWDDGTVRDINGIVQFMYGGDGFDAKELIPCRGLDFPFFCNPYYIASTLNSEAEYERDAGIDIGELRILTKDERNMLCSFVDAGCPGVQTEAVKRASYNIRTVLRVLLATGNIKIYESVIERFCRSIKDELEQAKSKNGFMAGLVSAASIGEPTTQMSELGETRIPLLFKPWDGKKDFYYNGPIGEIIDSMLGHCCSLVYNLGLDSVVSAPSGVDVYVNTVDPLTSKTEWRKIQEISRHPANGGMIKITTKTKRTSTTTLSHSHLRRCPKTGNILPVRGDKLEVGDFIPVCGKMNNNEGDIGELTIKGKVFPLDFEVGWLFGAYLSEGYINNGQIDITNVSIHFEKRCKKFAKKFGGKVRKSETKRQIYGKGKFYSSVTHHISGLPDLGRYLEKYCGTGSGNKEVPAFAFFAPDEFAGGLLRGYFDGDGNVNEQKQLIRVCSISKNLIETIALLLSRFGIFGSFSTETKNKEREDGKNNQPLITYIILRKHAQLFLENIGSDFPEKLKGIQAIVDYNNRDNVHSRREDIDLVPGIGETISNAAYPLNLPGYSRLYKRHEKKRFTGKETLRTYVQLFEESGAEGKEMDILRTAVNSDIIWDQIVSLEFLDDPKTLVYDLGVSGNHTFMTQSGIFTHNTLNSFHSTGMSAKDVTLGVPKLKELLNATKKPSKPTCTIYLNNSTLKSYEEKERNAKTPEEAKEYATNALAKVTEIANTFTHLTVGYFAKSYELQYLALPKEDITKKASPLNLITYREYEKRWWVSFSEKLGVSEPQFEPESWVILIEFDLDKLYTYKITPQYIVKMIEDDMFEAKGYTMTCVASPTNIGQMEVYLNFSEIRNFALSLKFDDGEDSEFERTLITPENNDYFTAREVAIDLIKKVRIQGIAGITKTYVRQDTKTKEWIIDAQGTNLAELLSCIDVDIFRTLSDDIWEVYYVFGIEAARAFLIEEITRMLSFDGTYINPRHISLLVDTMCRTGIITSVNRDGIPREVGPLAKGMFEKAVDNFAEAAAFAEHDSMKGVSAAVMYGTLPEVGTGTVCIKNSDKLPAVRKPVKLPPKKLVKK